MHVMKYEEILAAAKNKCVVYEEIKSVSSIYELKFDGVDFESEDKTHYLLLAECDEDCLDYNFYYRLWDEMPSEELRASTPWRKDPYEEM